MPKTKTQKQQIVIDLTDKLSRSKSIVFTDYKGMTMSQLSEIRNQLLENSAEFSITKNNLLKLALVENKTLVEEMVFEGPLATLFAFGDEVTPIKILTKSIQDTGIGKIKGGIMDGEFMDQYKISKLAALPSKEELQAKLVGGLGAPLYGIVGVLHSNLRNLVYALEQIRKLRGGEEELRM